MPTDPKVSADNQTKSPVRSKPVVTEEIIETPVNAKKLELDTDQHKTTSPAPPNNQKTGNTNMNISKTTPIKTILAALLIVVAGSATGFGVAKATNQSGPSKAANTINSIAQVPEEGLSVGSVVGSSDKDSFPDSAEGVLVKGGLEGEGSHRLLRPGGDTQTVYVTSSVTDLDELIDHKVKVWGETYSAQRVGWLMDVGGAEVLQLNAEKPATLSK